MELNDAAPAAPDGGTSDRALWARAVDGDREAFGQLFDRHGKAVYNYAFRRTADWSEAEDLTSTVFLHAWRRRSETVLDRDSALPWLLGIADGLLSNTRRRLRRAEALLRRLVSHDEPVGDHADRVAGLVDDERRMSEIHRALARLPRHEREVIELCVWSGLDQQAAAAVLKVAVGTVKSRLYRARRRLGADLVEGAAVPAPFSSGQPVNAKEVAR
ncbi:RNA polymerase sigma factor [Streptomyces sennicomposti]|uniref:RNA polymerase sigma factor n=1 Tax=Streptomyces sennicomposti TaxID=2873384 RepID=UPI0013A8CBC8|nr:sigma-70 family RNA polymerase sigma factor [Streptomyces sennicomposti]MBY8869202.1 sigma-70 family RNA polymerase sigma factor [Streptomyces sennicomposti]MYS39911.1 sigma-70 family RNA polymerase sigma factor [Streptomyces sp. SID5998]